MPERPNILLIISDQFRGDCMGYAGHPDVKTPYLDTLAAEGTFFENAYSACPSCIAARAAIMTGMSQEKNGRKGYKDGVPWVYPHTLAGTFSAAGYYTQMCGKMHVHPLRNNLGYANVDLHDGYLHYYRSESSAYYENQRVADDYTYWLKEQLGVTADHIASGIDCNSWVARPWPYDEKYHPTNWVTDRCIDFFRRRDRSMPFFLTASYVRPHPPYDPPKAYFDMYMNKALTPPHVGEWAEGSPVGHGFADAYAPADKEQQRIAMAGYYACISHLDNQIGRLLIAMFDANVLNNTVIMFVSDHGEMLFDHNMYRKSLPYRGSAKVPMLIKGPGLPSYKRETKVAGLRDVMPTLLTAAGIEVPETCDGIDLLSDSRRELLHGEHTYGDRSNHWLVSEYDKFISYPAKNKEQYFRLDTDPFELTDRINDPACGERTAQLRAKLSSYINK